MSGYKDEALDNKFVKGKKIFALPVTGSMARLYNRELCVPTGWQDIARHVCQVEIVKTRFEIHL
jgi:hypothetical protein